MPRKEFKCAGTRTGRMHSKQQGVDVLPQVDVQAVFNKVIDAGLYCAELIPMQEQGAWYKSPFMCNALRNAFDYGVITKVEADVAKVVIKTYLTQVLPTTDPREDTLEGSLATYGFSFDYPARRAIYRDWENRPFPPQKGT